MNNEWMKEKKSKHESKHEGQSERLWVWWNGESMSINSFHEFSTMVNFVHYFISCWLLLMIERFNN